MAGWLASDAEEVIVALGYHGLILPVYKRIKKISRLKEGIRTDTNYKIKRALANELFSTQS